MCLLYCIPIDVEQKVSAQKALFKDLMTEKKQSAAASSVQGRLEWYLWNNHVAMLEKKKTTRPSQQIQFGIKSLRYTWKSG